MREHWNGGTIETTDGEVFVASFEGELLGRFNSRENAALAIDGRRARKALEFLLKPDIQMDEPPSRPRAPVPSPFTRRRR